MSQSDLVARRWYNDPKKPDLLILDDFGMASLDPGACRDCLEVVVDRHGKRQSQYQPNCQWLSGTVSLKMIQY